MKQRPQIEQLVMRALSATSSIVDRLLQPNRHHHLSIAEEKTIAMNSGIMLHGIQY